MDAVIPLAPVYSAETNTLYFMPSSHPACDRSAAGPGFGIAGAGRGGFYFLFPPVIHHFDLPGDCVRCVVSGDSSCLELPWFSGLGSRTTLIQFIMQLHNCSQSPVDLDVK